MAINLGFSIGPALGGILSGISYNFLFVVNFCGAMIAGIIYVIFFRKRNKIFREKKKSETAEVIKETGKSLTGIIRFWFTVFCVLCLRSVFSSFSIQSRYFIKMLPS
jgi:hypothetical protein